MKESIFPRTLEQLETHVDGALHNLKLFSLQMDLALIVTLIAFEDMVQNFAPLAPQEREKKVNILSIKNALELLVPEILARCDQRVLSKNAITPQRDTLNDVTDALHFCQWYGTAVLAFTLYHQNIFQGTLNDRIADFTYTDGTTIGRAQLDALVTSTAEDQGMAHAMGVATTLRPPPSETYEELLQAMLLGEETGTFLRNIPHTLFVPVREMVIASLPKATIPPSTNCGNYTFGQYCTLWSDLSTLMQIYQFAHLINHQKPKESTPILSVLQVTLSEIATAIAAKGHTDYDLALQILPTLVLEAEKPDVLIQPFVPILSSDKLLIAPSLITTANWEVCLLRNLARNPETYGAVFGSLKERMADQLGTLFRRAQCQISVRKTFTDASGRVAGDVDVAVFDPTDGLLVLFETKWLIAPDSAQETTRGHKQIWDGIGQVLLARDQFESNSAVFLKQVFPGDIVTPENVKSLARYVVGHGDTGLKDDINNNVRVLHYELMRMVIKESKADTISEILSQVCAKQDSVSHLADNEMIFGTVKLAGFLFRTPATTSPETKEIVAANPSPEPDRNKRCLCGSGKKYKRCCLPISTHPDAFISMKPSR